MESCKSLPTFQRYLPPPPLELWVSCSGGTGLIWKQVSQGKGANRRQRPYYGLAGWQGDTQKRKKSTSFNLYLLHVPSPSGSSVPPSPIGSLALAKFSFYSSLVWSRLCLDWLVPISHTIPRMRLIHFPHDGSSKYLWNGGKLLLNYMALQLRSQPYTEWNFCSPAEDPCYLNALFSILHVTGLDVHLFNTKNKKANHSTDITCH
jgi:hypothetical protein